MFLVKYTKYSSLYTFSQEMYTKIPSRHHHLLEPASPLRLRLLLLRSDLQLVRTVRGDGEE